MLIALAVEQASHHYTGTACDRAMTILFLSNTCLLCVARLPILGLYSAAVENSWLKGKRGQRI
jgi:hypothetical protein